MATKHDSAHLSFAAISGAIVTVIFLTVIIIWADLSQPLWDWLKNTFSHHWVGKGVLATAVFFVSGAIAAATPEKNDDDLASAATGLYWTGVAAGLVLTLFYLYEAFVK